MSDELISKEKLLLGFPAKRTTTLLFLIEKQTALLAGRSLVEFSLNDSSYRHKELAFLEAFTMSGTTSLRPTIQDLERFADRWSVLVPENPRLKASLFHALSEKYDFTENLIPNILRVLDCKTSTVKEAYQSLYQKHLKTAFNGKISFIQRFYWTISVIAQWVDSLSPFWTTFLITISLGLPQAFLALPIAVANLGSILTIILLLFVGGINILTMVCMAEAVTRSGDFHNGKTFIKQLTMNYLGKTGSLVLSIAVGMRVFLIVLACYIGLSATIASLTNLPASICTVLLFVLGLYILFQKSINLTVTVTVLLAILNMSLLLFFSLLCFGNWQLDNALYINLDMINGKDFHPEIFNQVFGVILMLYFGHIYVGECSKFVLPKDPSGTSLIRGTIAGTAFLTFIFCIWIIAVNGAVAPSELSAQTGTVLELLTQQHGIIVRILGIILVLSLLGMAWLRSSSMLINLGREWISRRVESILTLYSQEGRLIFQTNDCYNLCSMGVTYLGVRNKQSRFNLDIQIQGQKHQVEIEVTQSWHIRQLFHQFPDLKRYGFNLDIEIQSANKENVCMKISSLMNLICEGKVEKSYSQDRFVGKQSSTNLSIEEKIGRYLLKQRQFLLSIIPLIIVFILTEILFFSNQQSFTKVLGFAGVLGNSLVGGIFPILLLVSSRRKGEILPGKILHLLNYNWLLVSIYGFSLFILLIHGLFIWENPVFRIAALGVTILSLEATLVMLKSGAFRRRTVIEIEEDSQTQGGALLKISTGGKAKMINVKLVYSQGEENYQTTSKIKIYSLDSLSHIIFQLPNKQLQELSIWTYINNLPTQLIVDKNKYFNLQLFGDKILLPIVNEKSHLKLEFASIN